MTDIKDRRTALMARTSTPALIAALKIVDGKTRTQEETMVRAWMLTELEARFPAASDAVEAAFEAAEAQDPIPEVDYVATLLANIPAAAQR